MSSFAQLEAAVLRDLSSTYALDAFEADEGPWDPAPGFCGMAHRDGGRSYTIKRGDSWWGIARRTIRANPKTYLTRRQYQSLMQNDRRNKGKRMRQGVVIYLPPIKTTYGWQTPACPR